MSSLLHKAGGLLAHTLAPGTSEAVQYHDEQAGGSALGTATPSSVYTSYSDHGPASASPPPPPPPPPSSSNARDGPDTASSSTLPPLDSLDVVSSAGDHKSGGEVPPSDALQGNNAIEAELAKMEARTTSLN